MKVNGSAALSIQAAVCQESGGDSGSASRDGEGMNDITLMWGGGGGKEKEKGEKTDLLLSRDLKVTFTRGLAVYANLLLLSESHICNEIASFMWTRVCLLPLVCYLASKFIQPSFHFLPSSARGCRGGGVSS